MKYCENTEMLQHWLYSCVQLPQVVAIGECGIDHTIAVDVELQEDLLTQHVKLAQQNSKALIIHSVRAYNDVLRVFKRTDCRQPIVFHKFMGTMHVYESFKDFDCYYSFGNELLTRSQSVGVLQNLPLNAILFENDDSEIAIDDIYTFAAQQLHISVEELATTVQQTAKKVFDTKFV
jgi:TatD DNase family protein